MIEALEDIDYTALGLAVAFDFLLYLFMFKDLFVDWSLVPVFYKIVTLVLGLPVFYLVAWKVLDNN